MSNVGCLRLLSIDFEGGYLLSRLKKQLVVLLLGMAMCAPSLMAQAQSTAYVTDMDVQVAVRAFGFAYGMPKGDMDIEIVYDPGNAVSVASANQLDKIIGKGKVFANRTLKARMVLVSQIGSTKSRLAYISHGLQPSYDTILAKAKNNKMLTFSTDFDCVASQTCVMGVRADPTIKIEISRAATSASELEFSQALKLMVREVE